MPADFKIEYFLRDHPGEQYPPFEEIPEWRAVELRDELARNLGVTPFSQNQLRFHLDLLGAGSWVFRATGEEFDAKEGELFSVAECLAARRVDPRERLYLDWGPPLKLESMMLADVDRYFSDIWYPRADELGLFDASLSWYAGLIGDGFVFAVTT